MLYAFQVLSGLAKVYCYKGQKYLDKFECHGKAELKVKVAKCV